MQVFSGIDLVYIPSFKEQVEQPGTRFLNNFSHLEIVSAKSAPIFTQSLAGKWAGKEAFIKAWSLALLGKPAPISETMTDLAEIEVLKDVYNRPFLRLSGAVKNTFEALFAGSKLSLSISHDGDYATSICTMTN